MRLSYVAPAVALVAFQMFGATPAEAGGCSSQTAIGPGTCFVPHSPWTWAEPEPTISWGLGFTGTIEAKVQGVYGATSIRTCTVIAGSGQCQVPRNDHMQCCTEDWFLLCTVFGVGTWSCGHTGG